MKKVLITGSNGLVGSACVEFFCKKGWDVYGIDNDTRGELFGKDASTKQIGQYLGSMYKDFTLYDIDVRNIALLNNYLQDKKFDLIIHAAAQPSHDKANEEPLMDFEINVVGTQNMLEMARKYSKSGVFVYMSTTKVYGSIVNDTAMKEEDTRYVADSLIDEDVPCQHGLHGIFGSNKLAADILVQEYGKYYKMNTVCFRPGCIIGKNQKGSRMHGFLGYLCKCISERKEYIVNGYDGKQVRDQLHVLDLVSAIWECYIKPRKGGEVYNIGGSEICNVSILEAIKRFEELLNKKAIIKMTDKNRAGDHIVNIHDNRKFKTHYPKWKLKYSLDDIFKELVEQHK